MPVIFKSLNRRSNFSAGASTICLAGGVAANSLLRCLVNEGAQKLGAKLCLPAVEFCGDNGAMIAAQGFYELQSGNLAGLDLNGLPTLPIDYNCASTVSP